MTFKERYGRWRRSEAVRGYLMLSPTAIYALLLLAIPLVTIFLMSFVTQTGVVEFDYTPTLANYAEAFREPIYRSLMLRSVLISLAVTLATVLAAFPIAYFVSFHVDPSKKSLWLFLITIPFWTSYLIRMSLWKVILGFKGPVNYALLEMGLIDKPLSGLLYNANAVVITLAHAYAPFAILPIFVALEKIDRSLLEAGQDLGENRIMTFIRVTLPLAVPGVVAAALIVFIPTVGDYVTPTLVGGKDGTMISNAIQDQFGKLSNKPLGATLAVLSMVVVAAISMAFIFLNRRYLKGSK
jgi:spermidine/putrescine transport system permease protein